jgi:hypothetical protein
LGHNPKNSRPSLKKRISAHFPSVKVKKWFGKQFRVGRKGTRVIVKKLRERKAKFAISKRKRLEKSVRHQMNKKDRVENVGSTKKPFRILEAASVLLFGAAPETPTADAHARPCSQCSLPGTTRG